MYPLLLKNKNHLTEINLSFNNIGNTFVIELLQKLKFLSLWSLNLRGNKIRAEAIKECIEFANQNWKILSIDIRDNPGLNKLLSKKLVVELKKNLELYWTRTRSKEKQLKKHHD